MQADVIDRPLKYLFAFLLIIVREVMVLHGELHKSLPQLDLGPVVPDGLFVPMNALLNKVILTILRRPLLESCPQR